MIYDQGDDDMPRSWRLTSGTPNTATETEHGTATGMPRAEALAVARELERRTGRHVFIEPADTQVRDAPGTYRAR